MQRSSVNTRAIIMYGLVGLVVLALMVGGITWAKSRSQQYASKSSQGQTAQNQQGNHSPAQSGTENNSSQSQSANQNQNQNNTSASSVAANGQTNSSQVQGAAVTGPSAVPATGSGDWLLLAPAIGVAAYSAARFVQSRRGLISPR